MKKITVLASLVIGFCFLLSTAAFSQETTTSTNAPKGGNPQIEEIKAQLFKDHQEIEALNKEIKAKEEEIRAKREAEEQARLDELQKTDPTKYAEEMKKRQEREAEEAAKKAEREKERQDGVKKEHKELTPEGKAKEKERREKRLEEMKVKHPELYELEIQKIKIEENKDKLEAELKADRGNQQPPVVPPNK
jgi:hypothetical protein